MRLLLIVVFAAFAQQARPDYNGTWVLNSDKSAKAIQEGTANERIMIDLTEKEVTLVSQGVAMVCGFGKVPTENNLPLRGILCWAKWDGDQVVATTTRKLDPTAKGTFPLTVTRLSRAGTQLKITSTAHLPGGNERTHSVVYDRAR
jgi:hypothetical protein